jgi:hypothetical protein
LFDEIRISYESLSKRHTELSVLTKTTNLLVIGCIEGILDGNHNEVKVFHDIVLSDDMEKLSGLCKKGINFTDSLIYEELNVNIVRCSFLLSFFEGVEIKSFDLRPDIFFEGAAEASKDMLRFAKNKVQIVKPTYELYDEILLISDFFDYLKNEFYHLHANDSNVKNSAGVVFKNSAEMSEIVAKMCEDINS